MTRGKAAQPAHTIDRRCALSVRAVTKKLVGFPSRQSGLLSALARAALYASVITSLVTEAGGNPNRAGAPLISTDAFVGTTTPLSANVL